MNAAVVLPWRSTGEEWRDRHFEYLHTHYSTVAPVVIGDPAGDFNRSAARNAGVAAAHADVVVVIDADNYIPVEQVVLALAMAEVGGGLVKPFTMFGYMTEKATEDFYLGIDPMPNHDNPWVNPPQSGFSGGAYAMRKDVWDHVGGFDEQFTGWGAEDDAFTIMCERILGPARRVTGWDYHLYHPSNERWASEANYNRLMEVYVHGNVTPRD